MTNPHVGNPYTQQSPQSPFPPPNNQVGAPLASYGQQQSGGQLQEHPQGTLILVFGIIGIMVTIFAPIAWYLGSKARKEIQASGVHYSNESNINAGRILGMIFTIIWLAFVGIFLLFVVGSGLMLALAGASMGAG